MSSGSALLSGSDFSGFLGWFSVCINCNFLFLPASAGVRLGNANIISTFIRKACLLGTDPAQGIPEMMWDELV